MTTANFMAAAATLVLLSAAAARIGYAQVSADEVLDRMDRIQRRQKNETAYVEMRLYDGARLVRSRNLTVLSTIDEDGRTSALVEFTDPPDIRGLKLLTIETEDGDEQRIYLPALRRIQRISGSSRNDRFAGSDLSYEDLRVRDSADYVSRMTDSTATSWTIESVPKDSESPYSRIEAEIDKTRYVVIKARYFDRKERLFKVLTQHSFVRYSGDLWKAAEIIMEDVLESRRTELTYRERDFETTIAPDVFSNRYLRRGVR